MVRNLRGGNKSKKLAKKRQNEAAYRPYLMKKKGQEYAKVIKSMGDGKMDIECYDGEKRLGILTGKMRKRTWLNKEDIILVNLRDYQDTKCDIIWKYNGYEISRLVTDEEITSAYAGIGNKGVSQSDMDEVDSVFDFNYQTEKTEKKESSGSSSDESSGSSDDETEEETMNIADI